MEMGHLLGLLVPIITALFATSFLAFWLRDTRAMYLITLSGAFSLLTVGFIITQYVFSKASVWNAPLTNLFFVTGVCFLIAAICLRRDLKVPRLMLACIGLTGVAMTIAIDLATHSISLRILANNYTLGALFLAGSWHLLRAPKSKGIDQVLFLITTVVGVQLFIISTITLLGQPDLTAQTYYGSIYWLAMNIAVVASLLVLTLVFITGFALDYAAAVKREAETDMLSGLRTRRAFERDVAILLAESKTSTGIILFDMDHFKNVNDAHGHAAGDAVIRAIGDLLNSLVRPGDISGRVGGEEFCIALKNVNLPATRIFAEGICRAITMLEIEQVPQDCPVSASFGITIHEPGNLFIETYKSADQALYAAKESGRNTVKLALKEVA